MYRMIPSEIAMTQIVSVGFISFLLEKHLCRSVFRCHEAVSQMPIATTINPSATCMNVIMTIGSMTNVPEKLKNVLKDGNITVSIVMMCSMTDVVISIPCSRNLFLFLNATAMVSRARTVICIAKLAVAELKFTSMNETINNSLRKVLRSLTYKVYFNTSLHRTQCELLRLS